MIYQSHNQSLFLSELIPKSFIPSLTFEISRKSQNSFPNVYKNIQKNSLAYRTFTKRHTLLLYFPRITKRYPQSRSKYTTNRPKPKPKNQESKTQKQCHNKTTKNIPKSHCTTQKRNENKHQLETILMCSL